MFTASLLALCADLLGEIAVSASVPPIVRLILTQVNQRVSEPSGAGAFTASAWFCLWFLSLPMWWID